MSIPKASLDTLCFLHCVVGINIKVNSPICQRYVHQHFLCKAVYLLERFAATLVPDIVSADVFSDEIEIK